MEEQEPINNYGIIDNRYEPVRKLGSGASGEVLLVKDLKLDGIPLALKIIYPHLLHTEGSFARFRLETRVTMQLSHPNILPTFGLDKTNDGLVYIKMEYNDGSALDRYIHQQRGLCSIDFSLMVLRNVAAGLFYAHNQGIIHRDLKPANILLSSDQKIRVADFGMAFMIRSEAKLTRKGSIVGTPHYLAPETLRGDVPDTRSDIYALGIVAFELLTGRVPYTAESFWELARAIQESPIPPIKEIRPDLPDWLCNVVTKCLKKDKCLRYTNMCSVLNELGGNNSGPVDSRSSWIAPTAVPVRNSPTMSLTPLRVRAQQFAVRMITTLILTGIFVAIPLVPPRVNKLALRTCAFGVFRIERFIGGEIAPLRKIFAIPIDVKWPNVAFQLKSFWDFGIPYINAGYPTDIFLEAENGYPIHAATKFCAGNLVAVVAGAGGDVNLKNGLGQTALGMAVEQGCESAIADLLDFKANPNIPDNNGTVPLHIAARRGRSQLVKRLIDIGANPNIADFSGDTPLHEAVLSGKTETVSRLLDAGADPKALNQAGKMPIDYVDHTTPSSVREILDAKVQ